ncbi:MAG: patatin-like phospholipase family protein [Victivallaceae bacterium]|nr:patatin-like phospholipase family protein [Victivallaceae bacterium]
MSNFPTLGFTEMLEEEIRYFDGAFYGFDETQLINPGQLAAKKLFKALRQAYGNSEAMETPGQGEENFRAGMVTFLNSLLKVGPEALAEQLGQDTADLETGVQNRLLLEKAFPEHLKPLVSLNQLLHKRRNTALCLSGGGIRSATFGLGIIQGLARYGLLKKINYLSTVSGGGYIGSWLSAWASRHPAGLAGVEDELRQRPVSPQKPEPQPLSGLRKYTNYLSPTLGWLSADTWTLIATYLRNLVLTWLIFIPLLMAVLCLPRLVESLIYLKPSPPWLWGVAAGVTLCSILALSYLRISTPYIYSFSLII